MADNTYMKFTLGVAAVVIVGLVLVVGREPLRKLIGCIDERPPPPTDVVVVIPPVAPEPIGEVVFRDSALAGHEYTRTSDYTFQVRGEHEDWGLGVEYASVYQGIYVVEQVVDSNDGKTMESEVAIKSRATNIRHKWTGGEVRIPKPLRVAILGAELLVNNLAYPPGTTEVLVGQLNKVLKTELAGQVMGMLPVDEVPNLNVEVLDGVVLAPVVYVDGKGVTSATIKRWPLFSDQVGVDAVKRFGENHIATLDAVLFPDRNVPVGGTWKIRGRHLPNLFPAAFNAYIDGEVILQRDPDENNMAVIRVVDGQQLTMVARPDGMRGEANISLQGKMLFDLDKKIISSGEFNGEVTAFVKSIDHLIFKMQHAVNPKFNVTYTCTVEPM